jgi:hypothetical protein
MFKKGDRIKFVKEIGDCTREVFTMGEIYKVHCDDRYQTNIYIINDDGNEWNFIDECFKLVKKTLKTEADYLDAFQQNFEEGV